MRSDADGYPRIPWDMDAYVERVRTRCFICALVEGDPDYAHHVVHRDDVAVVFLAKYPQVWGHLLVAPIEHREHVIGDFTLDEYAGLQRVVHAAGRSLRAVVPTERLYVLSLGSQSGNRHVHWHLAPCPPGLPYQDQQFALFAEARGYIAAPEEALAALAAEVRARMARDASAIE